MKLPDLPPMMNRISELEIRVRVLEDTVERHVTCKHCFCKRLVVDGWRKYIRCCECDLEKKHKNPRGWFR